MGNQDYSKRSDRPRRSDRPAEHRGGRRHERGDHKDRSSRPKDKRHHAQRGGQDRDRKFSRPQRSGFREERINNRQNDPDLPGDIDVRDLDPMVLQDLKVLSKDNAHTVAQHLIMAATLMQDDPQLALRHARAAKDRAGRVAVVRETAGIAAYHAGEWKEAVSELRAARRMSAGPGLVAVMADAERGLGRPQKAIEIANEVNPDQLDSDTRVELAIVSAGARMDLGQKESALVTLQRVNPDRRASGLTAARLSYAYADVLLANGDATAAKEWFQVAVEQDIDEHTDARARVEELNADNEA
ncbi:hypothetical protein CGERO_05210 [Corynebacterium gerontici]|uniref:Tetratricopeptide repeat protein n=2 Tax=Corynebacterium gerontici TaxID=2079234 RepID=A0A3G6IZY4_9CORY|nr:hypothetical protein [Corynebacterium gerontici]AZA11351.1 hypothetical protein CGERO_05210 [Corynebacterium gerontici]